MIVKFTNCISYTGGGKIPFRLRKNYNHRFEFNDGREILSDEELIKIFEYNVDYRVLTTNTTKVIRDPKSNYQIKHERHQKRKSKY